MSERWLEVRVPEGTVRCEYLVIGSGVGGSVAAWELSRAGKDVVIAEEGGYFPTSSFRAPVGELTRKLYRMGGVTPFFGKPSLGFAEARCVGGGSVINGALLWRTPPWILESWEKEHKLLGYDEAALRPHFERWEAMLGVRDTRGAPGNQDSALLAEASRSLGWKVEPARRALGECRNTNRCATGCPTGAKRTMPLTYLSEAIDQGARLMAGTEIVRLVSSGGRITEAVGYHQGKRVRFLADHYFFAAGPVQTPHLLKRNGLSREAGERLKFHLNLKFVATFDRSIRASEGTMFTEQVQQFERRGLYLMASNWLPHYAAATLGHLGRRAVETVLEDFDRSALYVAQIRPKAAARVNSLFRNPIVWHRLAPSDLEEVRFGFEKMGEVLFEAGAKKLYLPLQGEAPVTSPAELRQALSSLSPQRLELISVHAMGSCPMSGIPGEGIVDLQGRVRGVANAWICDASVLPDNIGESPQGTILAFAHEILGRHLAA
jgi:choline dehydrogenase-like flavoprotein